MSDYKGVFSETDFGLSQNKYSNGIFKVAVVKTSCLSQEVWSCEIEANSPKQARQKWREEYPEVKEKYDGQHVLPIKRVCN